MMESHSDSINQFFMDFFTIFSLGMRKSSTSSRLHYLLLFLNVSFNASIVGFYVAKGSLFISADALSKGTDLVDLFFPVLVHMFTIIKFTSDHGNFSKFNAGMDLLDVTFNNLNPEKFMEMKACATFLYTLKFLTVHTIGAGIDTFMLIT